MKILLAKRILLAKLFLGALLLLFVILCICGAPLLLWLVYVAALVIGVKYASETGRQRMEAIFGKKEDTINKCVAPASIEKIEQITGAYHNDLPQMRFWVTAYPENMSHVQLEIRGTVSLAAIPRKGDQVYVAFDPEKPKGAMILGKKYAGQFGIPDDYDSGVVDFPYSR